MWYRFWLPFLLVLSYDTSQLLGQIPSDFRSPTHKVRVTGERIQELTPFDELMTSFVREHRIPGAALAVSREGKLVYSRGFGLANIEKKQPVEPTTRFRLASLSKPITAAAILTLVRDDKLRLNEKLVDIVKPLNVSKLDIRINKITIADLLRHRGGWDRDESFDPMFRAIRIGKHFEKGGPADIPDTIRFMFAHPLDFDPGERYAYSNFGYCLLGRVIEQRSGNRYGDYVQEMVFKPLGIQSAALGKSLSTAPNEATYYTRDADIVEGVVDGAIGKKVPRQYGGQIIENFDAHGGWIASAEDTVRFASAFDDGSKLLPAKLIKSAFTPLADESTDDVFYGIGWSVRQRKDGSKNTWHTGAISGTSTLLVRRHDNLSWAVLFNARHNHKKKQLASLIDPLVHRAADAVAIWPTTPH